VITKITKSK